MRKGGGKSPLLQKEDQKAVEREFVRIAANSKNKSVAPLVAGVEKSFSSSKSEGSVRRRTKNEKPKPARGN